MYENKKINNYSGEIIISLSEKGKERFFSEKEISFDGEKVVIKGTTNGVIGGDIGFFPYQGRAFWVPVEWISKVSGRRESGKEFILIGETEEDNYSESLSEGDI